MSIDVAGASELAYQKNYLPLVKNDLNKSADILKGLLTTGAISEEGKSMVQDLLTAVTRKDANQALQDPSPKVLLQIVLSNPDKFQALSEEAKKAVLSLLINAGVTVDLTSGPDSAVFMGAINALEDPSGLLAKSSDPVVKEFASLMARYEQESLTMLYTHPTVAEAGDKEVKALREEEAKIRAKKREEEGLEAARLEQQTADKQLTQQSEANRSFEVAATLIKIDASKAPDAAGMNINDPALQQLKQARDKLVV